MRRCRNPEQQQVDHGGVVLDLRQVLRLCHLDRLHHRTAGALADVGDPPGRFRAVQLDQIERHRLQNPAQQIIVRIDKQTHRLDLRGQALRQAGGLRRGDRSRAGRKEHEAGIARAAVHRGGDGFRR